MNPSTLLRHALLLGALLLPSVLATRAEAFCGFYVGKAGGELFNKASKVVIARDGERTILSMSNDFQGDLREFAMVIPVPTVLKREQIHVGEQRLFDRIDAYSAPRLVEYFDPNPCEARYDMESDALGSVARGGPAAANEAPKKQSAASLGVKVEATYSVGEYDIAMLSAEQSDGLERYLLQEGYAIPPRASAALAPYIRQGMKFFVAKVNLSAMEKSGAKFLRPLQMAFVSPKFVLPLRLGMANARGAQDMLVFTLTRKGRVESANYRTVKVPAEVELPLYVRGEFGPTYTAIFEAAHKQGGFRSVHTEYVWDSGWCDPCADQPLSPQELKGLGVFWLDQPQGGRASNLPAQPILTRLHVRYDAEHFPEDLVFQETGDRQNFQARYILRNPAPGDLSCPAGVAYRKERRARQYKEAETLSHLTGLPKSSVLARMQLEPETGEGGDGFWKNVWK